ncbi:hypothetical protein ASPACDRAFT_81103 [Aspergillus aculeatus ATCC 16872]|uniref:Uncharacterized protein n=1 Tax=Aspergillus aculeatus (strain ATCC 16872 / CBS 172.66 / WB 5094) TaxID=690307 RepID=A0A1L9WLB7_ASPA1|nr:uncharacterized protein ASPACDRAFT_81103 [Aspergillus aculeatus ATCC 16872]OJJ96949.1 hypothetical protein ASPACDRAFT_81103 [Aspergillus aculeatus ATCC 16872]
MADTWDDTALPPMSSKQLIVSTRRARPAETSLLSSTLRGPSRQGAVPVPAEPPTVVVRGSSTHRRTGSTLKTVMRKIFTRKTRGDESVSPPPRGGSTSPTMERCLPSQALTFGSRQQHQHSPALFTPSNGTVTSFAEALQKLDSHPRRRRATLPSLILSDDGSRGALEAAVQGRPVSKRDNSPHANSDPLDVCRRRERQQLKRRSRSAAALRGLAQEHHHLMSPIQWRRRSLESCAASTAYGAPSEVDRPPTRTTVASAPALPTETSVLMEEPAEPEDTEPEEAAVEPEAEDEREAEPEDPIPTNVGTLVTSMQHDEHITLEQRLNILEVKMIDLEFAIARLQTDRSESPAESRQAASPVKRHRRKQSSGPNKMPPPIPTQDTVLPDRPSSTSTLRPTQLHRSRTLQAPSSTSLTDHSTISVEQYSALVMLLRREQTARRSLEQQVAGLREDMEQLTQMARDSMGLGMGPIYPIPISDLQDFRRMRPGGGLSSSESSRPETVGVPGESDSEWERNELSGNKPLPVKPAPEVISSRWSPGRRMELGGMI